MEEIKTVKVDGVVVTVPAGERAYLITEVPKAWGKEKKVEPFEKVPIEERIASVIEKIKEALAKKKVETVK